MDPAQLIISLKNYDKSNDRSVEQLDLFSENPSVEVKHETIHGQLIPRIEGEFWTARQRQADRIHEITYRACFKPQLPGFFIDRMTDPDDTVYDPFAGRGTTLIEAAIRGRQVIACDINPLSRILIKPRLNPPSMAQIQTRLNNIQMTQTIENEIDLSMFYHHDTESELLSIREYLHNRFLRGEEDSLDEWIRMVATNRLSGHSPGFFSVYSLPPNQAVSPQRQILINQKTGCIPVYRDVKDLILRKSKQLLSSMSSAVITNLKKAGNGSILLTSDCRTTPQIQDESVHLTVTSPPFLGIVQYSQDNWLRCWFNHITLPEGFDALCQISHVTVWSDVMRDVLNELFRVTVPGGWVVFEVGEVKNGTIRLEEIIAPLGLDAGFQCAGIMINRQKFTKTANIWGVSNNRVGTNSNRIVLLWKNPIVPA